MYKDWVEKEIDANPRDFDDFQKGRGIIEARDKFLKWFESTEGQEKFAKLGGEDGVVDSEAIHAVEEKSEDPEVKARHEERDSKKGKLVIVPIAVPGCGAS